MNGNDMQTASTVDDGFDVYPLSVTDLKRLTWFRSRIEAKEWLALHHVSVDGMDAARLAFVNYLVATGRLTEHVGVLSRNNRVSAA